MDSARIPSDLIDRMVKLMHKLHSFDGPGEVCFVPEATGRDERDLRDEVRSIVTNLIAIDDPDADYARSIIAMAGNSLMSLDQKIEAIKMVLGNVRHHAYKTKNL